MRGPDRWERARGCLGPGDRDAAVLALRSHRHLRAKGKARWDTGAARMLEWLLMVAASRAGLLNCPLPVRWS